MHYSTRPLALPSPFDLHRQWSNLAISPTTPHQQASANSREGSARFISGFHFQSERSAKRGGKVVQGGAASERGRGLHMDYLCSDSWMEKMTPEVEDFCWMEARKVNSLLLLKSCTTLSVMCAGAWTALPTSEGEKSKMGRNGETSKLLTGDETSQRWKERNLAR